MEGKSSNTLTSPLPSPPLRRARYKKISEDQVGLVAAGSPPSRPPLDNITGGGSGNAAAPQLCKRDVSTTGIRAKSPGVEAEAQHKSFFVAGSSSHHEDKPLVAKGTTAVQKVSTSSTGMTEGTMTGARGGRKLSFLGFARQLASHGNFWL